MLSLSIGFGMGGFKHSVNEVLKMMPTVEENTRKLDALTADELVKAYSNSLEACTKRLNYRIEG